MASDVELVEIRVSGLAPGWYAYWIDGGTPRALGRRGTRVEAERDLHENRYGWKGEGAIYERIGDGASVVGYIHKPRLKKCCECGTLVMRD